MKLMYLAQFLQSQSVGVVGTDLFVNRMPETVAAGILLLTKSQGFQIDPYTQLRKGGFQVIVRHTDFELGEALIRNVMTKFENWRTITSPGIEIRSVLLRHEPISFPLSVGNVIELFVTYDVVYAIK